MNILLVLILIAILISTPIGRGLLHGVFVSAVWLVLVLAGLAFFIYALA